MSNPMTDNALRDLRATGFSILRPLAPEQIAETNAYLLSRPVHVDAHVPQTARNRGEPDPVPREQAAGSECLCVPTRDAILAPHVFERALHLTDVAAAYLERDPPVCYSANVFWTRPGAAEVRKDIQAFHRDEDDVRFLAMFVYLADVLVLEDGPQELEGPDGEVRGIYGPAGTVFLADTMRPHRGGKPQRHERGLFWFRWGVSDHPPANVWDKIEPIPAAELGRRLPYDVWLRESMKLLVAS